MKTTLLVAATIILMSACSALADFYVIENQATHKCTMINQNYKPRPSMTEQIVGNTVYKTQQEAEAAMRTEKACANTPTGAGPSTPVNPGTATSPRF